MILEDLRGKPAYRALAPSAPKLPTSFSAKSSARHRTPSKKQARFIPHVRAHTTQPQKVHSGLKLPLRYDTI